MTALAPHVHPPAIVPEAIEAYCDVVFGYLDGHAPIRLLTESGTHGDRPVLEFPKTIEVAKQLIAVAAQAADRQQGVFVVPATVDVPGSAKVEDIRQTGVILIDLDDGDIRAKREHLARHVGIPTLVIASGGLTSAGQTKLHLYWRLSEPATGDDLQRVCRLRGMLAETVGGDRSFRSAHQPIRVPGTIHGKQGRKAPVRVLEQCKVEYHLDEIAERIEAMPAPPGMTHEVNGDGSRPNVPSAMDLATRRIRAGAMDEITRFEALSKAIGHWLRNTRRGAVSLEEAWIAVCQHNEAMIEPPWNDVRLRREFDALLRKDILRNGAMPADASEVTPPSMSDDALALAFTKDCGAEWRHVAAMGWFHWTGTVWTRDDVHLGREQARQVCRFAAASIDAPREARRVASEKTIAAVLRVASSDPSLARRADALDAYPMLLNTPAGLLDLETGELGPHDRTRLITQITSASPGKECPRWMAFLAEVTGGDRDLQDYLARLAGYCLTGSTSEQIFAFFHGAGANGKSVFLQTIAAVMGDYAATATLDSFMASGQTRHLSELAGLRASRLVLVPETEAGRSWAEARIKTITGGERLRANFMRQDHFEFRPQFKLLVAGNHRPELHNVGEAMRRRLHVVPFGITIAPVRRDPRLSEKLLVERDGILGWMIDGCADWLRLGLAPPRTVVAAAEEYFASEDMIGQWIEEACETDPTCRTPSAALFRSWSGWAEAAGVMVGSQRSLGEALRSRGFRSERTSRTRSWQGIGLRSRSRSLEADQ